MDGERSAQRAQISNWGGEGLINIESRERTIHFPQRSKKMTVNLGV